MTKDDTAAANAISGIVQKAAADYLTRERAGSSASMNGALDYVELRIIEKLREIGWGRLTQISAQRIRQIVP